MAVDKLVDSAQLNSDLTSVANAIRTKGGTSAQLAFPSGFVTAIGNISTGGTPRTSDDLEVSGATVTAPAGTYASAASKSVASGTATTPATTVTANPTISVNTSTGLITATASATKSVTPTVSTGYVSSGTAGTITVSGSNTSQLSTQSGATITPTTSEQTAVAANKYTLDAVKVAAMPSGTAGTPTATKGTVTNHSVDVTPSVTNTTGYITGSTKTGTAVTVSASELVSGSETKTANGTYDVTNLAQLIVNVAGGGSGMTYETGTYTPTADISKPTINFSNSHTNRPFIVIMQDMGGVNNIAEAGSNLVFAIVNWYDFFGDGIYGATSNVIYARIISMYKTTGTMTGNAYSPSSLTGTSSSGMPYWLSNTSFMPESSSTSRKWRSGRTYKWVAVWGPTT